MIFFTVEVKIERPEIQTEIQTCLNISGSVKILVQIFERNFRVEILTKKTFQIMS